MGNDEDLVALVYEAGAIPERWSAALTALSSHFGSAGSNLIRSDPAGVLYVPTASIAETTREFDRLGWSAVNTRVERLLARSPYPGFLTDSDLHTEEELRTLPMYTEFLEPRGFAAGAATHIRGAHDDELILAFEGFASHQASRDALPRLLRLRPHLGRALVLSSQLRLRQVKAAAAALDAIGVGAAFLDHQDRLQAANNAFESEIGSLLVTRSSRIRAAHARSDPALEGALEALTSSREGRSIVLRRAETGEPVVLHLLPVRGDARDVFAGTKAIVILSKTNAAHVPAADLIEALFDVTPAEARVARAVAQGQPLIDIASATGVSINTIRTQLKRVFDKSGVSRQGELAVLLRQYSRPYQMEQRLRSARTT